MSAKKLLPLIVVLAVLAALAVVQKSRQKPVNIVEQVNLEQVIPDGLKSADVVRIELFAGGSPDEKVVLAKSDDAWQVTSHFNAPAKAETVTEYLDKIMKLKGEFRQDADSDEVLADYNLKDGQAFHVQIFKADEEAPAADVLVGESPKYRTVFIRKAGSQRVYVESANLRGDAGVYGEELDKAPTADKWLDKDILKLEDEEADAVTRLALTMPDKALVFEKKEKAQPPEETPAPADGETPAPEPEKKKEFEWILASGGPGGPFKQAGLDKVLAKIKSLQATNVVDPAKLAEWGLEQPAFKAVVGREGKDDIVIEGGRPDPAGSGYLRVASANNGVVYELSKYIFEQLFVKGADLFDLPPISIPKEGLTRIEVNQPEGRVVAEKADGKWSVLEPVLPMRVQNTAFSSLENALGALAATGLCRRQRRYRRFRCDGKPDLRRRRTHPGTRSELRHGRWSLREAGQCPDTRGPEPGQSRETLPDGSRRVRADRART